MVLIRNDLSCGDREAAAVLVGINSVFQIVAFAGRGWFYLSVLPGWLGLEQTVLDLMRDIARSVLIFLGIPLLAGYLTRRLGERVRGRDWYEQRLLPRLGPFALYGLLSTVVVLFALQGEAITRQPLDAVRIALPLLAELAVAVAVFGVTSSQALAGVVGPLIEAPVLVALVYVSLWGSALVPRDTRTGATTAAAPVPAPRTTRSS